MHRVVLLAALACCIAATATAIKLNIVPTPLPEFRLASIYGSNMVLQMAPKRAHIWGYGKPFSEIILTFNDNHFTTTVAQNGTWSIRLPPQPAGGPHIMTFKHVPFSIFCLHNNEIRQLLRVTTERVSLQLNCDSHSVVLDDVMFGDVWVCSGGSNMAQELHMIEGAHDQILRARRHSTLRLFQVSRQASASPSLEPGVIREWETTDQEVLLDFFPALCLIHAMNMADILGDRPIGMIEAAWGGTPIEAWVSPRVTEKCHTPLTEGSDQYSNHALWNGMIHPLTKIAIRGVVWHQGETNTAYNRDLYGCHFKSMIADWRAHFLDANVKVHDENDVAFPFGFLQLGASLSHRDLDWWKIRRQQTTHGIADTFMASTYDLLDPLAFNVTGLGSHYRDKVTAAKRLAATARQLLYTLHPVPNHESGLKETPNAAVIPELISVSNTGAERTINITFNCDIRVQGSDGFAVQLENGSVVPVPILGSWSRGVTLRLLPDIVVLIYGWGTAPCGHQRCAVYSDDDYLLPAAVFSHP